MSGSPATTGPGPLPQLAGRCATWRQVFRVVATVPVLLAMLACGRVGDEQSRTQSDATLRATPDARAERTSSMKPSDLTPEQQSLPQRSGAPPQTTDSVPHVQVGVDPVPEIHDELLRQTFALPDVENRPTIASLPGARGVWISEGVSLAHAEAIVAGREFTHIHPDGSLHAPLPFERAIQAVNAGWAERHPWADQKEGWEGLVLLYTPRSLDELAVVLQLIVESYNFVTGREVERSDS